MMSKASTLDLAEMTQRAINSAKYTALPRVVDVVVMEQCNVQYTNATTVLAPGAFNYNAFANGGARLGSAPHIVVANNDLKFHDGWLDALLAANWPVCSPVHKGYHRHRDVMANETGQQVGRHLAGWCYMITRELWEQIGEFDESYPFWCADNAVMRQLAERNIRPMLVRDSHVDHEVSTTLFREPPEVQAELTWAAVERFNREHGTKIGERDARFEHWQQRHSVAGRLGNPGV
jgi:hypothetical protein